MVRVCSMYVDGEWENKVLGTLTPAGLMDVGLFL